MSDLYSTRIKNKMLLHPSPYVIYIFGLLLVIALTYITEVSQSDIMMATAGSSMSIFMGFFFLIFGIPKIFGISRFSKSFRRYDLISKKFHAYSYSYPFIELLLAVLLLSGITRSSSLLSVGANVVIVITSSSILFGMLEVLAKGEHIEYACMGAVFKLPLSKFAVVECGSMLAMAVYMISMNTSSYMMIGSM